MPKSEDAATSIVVKFFGALEPRRRESLSYQDLQRLRNAIRDSIDEAVVLERDRCVAAAEASLPDAFAAVAVHSACDSESIRRKWTGLGTTR